MDAHLHRDGNRLSGTNWFEIKVCSAKTTVNYGARGGKANLEYFGCTLIERVARILR